MHMFEIYEDYLEDLEVDKVNINHKYAEKNFSSQDFKTLSQSLHFGREGKLYFPEIGSEENILIESKLEKYQIIKQDNKKATANLQVNLFLMWRMCRCETVCEFWHAILVVRNAHPTNYESNESTFKWLACDNFLLC